MAENIVKRLFTEWDDLSNQKKGLSKQKRALLKKDVEYLELTEDLKKLKDSIEDYKLSILEDIEANLNEIKNNMELIVDDSSRELDLEPSKVKKLFSFVRRKCENGDDELTDIFNANTKVWGESND